MALRQTRGSALIVIALVVLTVAMPLAAFASDYSSTLSYTYKLTGATRSYSHGNINITAYCSSSSTAPITTHVVRLYRDNAWPKGDDYIGYKTWPRRGSGSGRWTSVGSGNYYFKFEKSDDGVRVYSDYVHMWCD
ncbi:MAG: hypothetical protein EG823_09450 [Actinobacteria bacterium]|nr:hypothetical protein [Actinomycetota bacterium]